LFSGEYWTGRTAVELGLADAVGELRSVLRERFGDKVVTPVIAPERSLLGRLRPGVGLESIGRDGFADELISALEARALWARYGL
jgi:serine protease SohB